MSTTPNNGGGAMAEMLAALWAKSRDGILERVTVIEAATLALRNGSLDVVLRADAERAAHKLAGVAGTFGYGDATELAREAEAAFGGTDEFSPDMVLRLSAIAVALREQLE
ncbi:MAG: Hpt domain-containing protein [bacterium]